MVVVRPVKRPVEFEGVGLTVGECGVWSTNLLQGLKTTVEQCSVNGCNGYNLIYGVGVAVGFKGSEFRMSSGWLALRLLKCSRQWPLGIADRCSIDRRQPEGFFS